MIPVGEDRRMTRDMLDRDFAAYCMRGQPWIVGWVSADRQAFLWIGKGQTRAQALRHAQDEAQGHELTDGQLIAYRVYAKRWKDDDDE